MQGGHPAAEGAEREGEPLFPRTKGKDTAFVQGLRGGGRTHLEHLHGGTDVTDQVAQQGLTLGAVSLQEA